MKTENGITRRVVAFWLLALLIGCAGAIANAQSTGGAETDAPLAINETAAMAGPNPPPDNNIVVDGSNVQVVVSGTSVNLTASVGQIPEKSVTTHTTSPVGPNNDDANGMRDQMKNDSTSTTVSLSKDNADKLLQSALKILQAPLGTLSRLIQGNITNIEMEWAALTGETSLAAGSYGL